MMSLVGKERVKGKNLIPLHQYILHVLEACIHKRHFWKYGIRGENLSVTFWHDIHYGGKKVELGHIIGQAVIGQHEDGSQTQACITMQMRLYHKDFRFLSWILGLQFPDTPPPTKTKKISVGKSTRSKDLRHLNQDIWLSMDKEAMQNRAMVLCQ